MAWGLDLFTNPGAIVYMAVNMNGVVINIRQTKYGEAVYIQYGDWVVVYQHIDSHLEEGMTVKPGDDIGTVVYNPEQGTHLHIEVRNGKPIYNPLMFMSNQMADFLLGNFTDPAEFAQGYDQNPASYINTVLKNGGCVIWKSTCGGPGK